MGTFYDERSHPLLAQVPLTVSPFVSLPTATTLPYTYKSLPSTLPPSAIDIALSSVGAFDAASNSDKPKYIVSSTGTATHPEDIITSCRALQAHLLKQQEDAALALQMWEQEIKDRELAEKRRVAPGWLDSEAKLLQPEKKVTAASEDLLTGQSGGEKTLMDVPVMKTVNAEGEELDRAFGGMKMG